MALPEPLKRFFGLGGMTTSEEAARPALMIPAMGYRPPQGASADWISVPIKSASPTTTALAVLRHAGGPLRARVMQERVLALLTTTSEGSVSNAGTRLEQDGIIKRDDDGWLLMEAAKAPILHEERLWGPPAIFGKYELAAYRRDAIKHLLGLANAGLQTSQVIDQLQQCQWLHVLVNKEIVQDDMEVLQAEKVIRRRGASKKWELMPEKGEE
jgi:hypothetical protein